MDSRKCQTATATPAEPGDLPWPIVGRTGNVGWRHGDAVEWCRVGHRYSNNFFKRHQRSCEDDEFDRPSTGYALHKVSDRLAKLPHQ